MDDIEAKPANPFSALKFGKPLEQPVDGSQKEPDSTEAAKSQPQVRGENAAAEPEIREHMGEQLTPTDIGNQDSPLTKATQQPILEQNADKTGQIKQPTDGAGDDKPTLTQEQLGPDGTPVNLGTDEPSPEPVDPDTVIYTSHPIMNFALGPWQFVRGELKVLAEDVERFEKLLAANPVQIRNQVRKLDANIADALAKRFLNQPRLVTGVDTTANSTGPDTRASESNQ